MKLNLVFKRKDILLLLLILVIGLLLRLYKIDNPVADWHSWRQADTASVARNFVRDDFDLMHPKFDDLGRNQSGLDNPQGYRFVEFPFYNSLFALVFKIYPGVPIETYGRLTTIFFSLLLLICIYILLHHEENQLSAFFGGLTFAIMPFFIYYSRVILPEMASISLIFLAIIFLYFWPGSFKKTGALFYILSLVTAALSLLVKPYSIFFLLPIILIFYQKKGFKMFSMASFYAYFIFLVIPLGLWRLWIQNFPEGIPASTWLIAIVNTYQGPQNIFFKPAFFRWIFYERIPNLILGSYLVFPFIFGLIKKPKKSWLLHSIFVSSLIYLFTFQGGNVQHDYYQTFILPALAIMTGVGFGAIITEKRIFSNRILIIITMIIIFGFSFAFSYYKVKDYYSTDPNLIKIAKIINTVTPPNAKIVTDRDGDTTLLYLADRKGVAAVYEDLSIFKNKGFKYFVTLHEEIATEVKKQYKTIFENDQVFIFKL